MRDATLKQMMANEAGGDTDLKWDCSSKEIQNLIKIIGLDLNREPGSQDPRTPGPQDWH